MRSVYSRRNSPEALIEALRPDVLIKGANHALEDVVGAYLVRGWGGRVLQIDLLQEQLPQAGMATLKT